MSIKEKMKNINNELVKIEHAQGKIRALAVELNKLNPLSVGQELIVNSYSHNGKILVAEKVFVSDLCGHDVAITANEPYCFTAHGAVKKKDGSLGSYTGVHDIRIKDLLAGLNHE